MGTLISERLSQFVAALPLQKGMRILEIGCGTGVAAKAIAGIIGTGYIVGIDRSAKAIEQAIKQSQPEIATGILVFKQVAIEDFEWPENHFFDFAFAIRVGALDGRHPEIEAAALRNIAKVLQPKGRLYIDGGNPLKEIKLKS